MSEKIELFENTNVIPAARVLCIGDVMLDRFIYGSIERISPEAPIPVLLEDREKHMLGGAGNVVANIAMLGAKAMLVAAVGSDAAGTEIQNLLKNLDIQSVMVVSPDRFTTVKTRFMCGMQQVLRVDREKTIPVAAVTEDKIIKLIMESVPQSGAVILSDYKKGLLTDKIVSPAIECAHQHGKPVIVDPKGTDFSRYRGATVITPNRKELETATGMKAGTDDEVRAAALKLIMSCGIETVLATRGKDGLSIITRDAEPVHIPAQVREIFDVSGAGDTVIGSFTLAIAAGASPVEAAILSNHAAGIVVGKVGTAVTTPDELLASFNAQDRSENGFRQD